MHNCRIAVNNATLAATTASGASISVVMLTTHQAITDTAPANAPMLAFVWLFMATRWDFWLLPQMIKLGFHYPAALDLFNVALIILNG